jgi:hypothetical protein
MDRVADDNHPSKGVTPAATALPPDECRSRLDHERHLMEKARRMEPTIIGLMQALEARVT